MSEINTKIVKKNYHVLITGANGFVGRAVMDYLKNDDLSYTYKIQAAVRNRKSDLDYKQIIVGNIDRNTNWHKALKNIDIVIHLAARVHVMNETSNSPLENFRQMNVEATRNLAQQAIENGVKRFVYISSIKVNAESTDSVVLTANDVVNPQDPYSISKFEAEQTLLSLSALDVVIIRPPLVYGRGMKGNLSRLIKIIKTGIPLPFRGIENKRSLVSTLNLSSLIEICMHKQEAVGEIFLVSDGKDISTTELIIILAQAVKQKILLFYIPAVLIKFVSIMVGKKPEFDRLFGSLQVDIEKNKTLLGWQPKFKINDVLNSNLE